jgi:hypothetical protein
VAKFKPWRLNTDPVLTDIKPMPTRLHSGQKVPQTQACVTSGSCTQEKLFLGSSRAQVLSGRTREDPGERSGVKFGALPTMGILQKLLLGG